MAVPFGLLTKVYAGPGHSWVVSSAGGVFYVVFWVFLVLALAPRLSPGRVSIVVLVVTSALEFLQLWQPPLLVQVRSTFVGHTILGSTFAWLDFVHYLAGCGIAYAVARYVGKHRSSRAV